MGFDLVIIGCSAGGLLALETILGALPGSFALPILVVQHRSPESELLCEVLQGRSRLPVRDVLDKEPIEAGCVYVAPPDYHVLVEPGEFSLSTEERVRFARPSIDVALSSAADAYGERLIGIVLTGANEDGAAGAQRIERRGGRVIVQDPATAEVSRMPAATLAAVKSAEVLPVEGIGPRLLELATSGTATRSVRRPA